jgi:16S rRNA G527 N7-methylase RsmG
MTPEQMKNLHDAVKQCRGNIESLDAEAKAVVYRAVRDMRKLVELYGPPGDLAVMLVASENSLKRNSQ